METVDLEEIKHINHEINNFHANFRNLLVAIEYGNDAFNAGNLHRALKNYLAAEQMMKQFEENGRGHGVCRCNIGNVQSHLNEVLEAEESYRFAIENAEHLLSLEKDQTAVPVWEILLAERKMNLGSLKSFVGDFAAAKLLYEQVYQLFRKNNHLPGITQLYGNKGLLLINEGKIDEAAELINDVYDDLNNSSSDRSPEQVISLQYAIMSKGKLCIAQNKPQEALAFFLYVLQKFETVIRHVQLVCVEEAMKLCVSSEINKPEVAYQIYSVARDIFKDLKLPESQNSGAPGILDIILKAKKDLVIVLDVSAGMFGPNIRKCRKFIKKMIADQIRIEDRVRLEVFNNKTRTVFNWTKIEPDSEQTTKSWINSRIDTDTRCNGHSALLESIIATVDSMSNRPDSPAQWICVLTDGYDDCSRFTMNEVVLSLNSQNQVGIIFVAVGDLVNDQKKIEELRVICEASRGGGLFLKMNDSGESASVDSSPQVM
ncbi:hypothetical protein HK096_003180, partial [Nowakowskiella sp. JEL0078]